MCSLVFSLGIQVSKSLPYPKSYCGTIQIHRMNSLVDIYEDMSGRLEAFDGEELVRLSSPDLNYLISMGKILDWRLREKFIGQSSCRTIWI